MIHRVLAALGSLIVLLLCAGYLWYGDPLERLASEPSQLLLWDDMAPTLLQGDVVAYDVDAYRERDPVRGEIALLRVDKPGVEPEAAGPDREVRDLVDEAWIVSRVVGLPGDEIEIRDERLFLNGHEVEERAIDRTWVGTQIVVPLWETRSGRWLHRVVREKAPAEPAEPLRMHLPDDLFFALGDNRSYALDSRRFGPFSRSELIGRMAGIQWSWDLDSGWPRWRRFGSAPEQDLAPPTPDPAAP